MAIGAGEHGIIQVIAEQAARIIAFGDLVNFFTCDAGIGGGAAGRVAIDASEAGAEMNISSFRKIGPSLLPTRLRTDLSPVFGL